MNDLFNPEIIRHYLNPSPFWKLIREQQELADSKARLRSLGLNPPDYPEGETVSIGFFKTP